MTNAHIDATQDPVRSAQNATRSSHPYFERSLRYTSVVDSSGRLRLACFSQCPDDEDVSV